MNKPKKSSRGKPKKSSGEKTKPKTAQRFADGETRIKFWKDKLSALQEIGVSMKQFIKDAASYHRLLQAYHATEEQIKGMIKIHSDRETISRKQDERNQLSVELSDAGDVIYGEAVALKLPTKPLNILHFDYTDEGLTKALKEAHQLIREAQALAVNEKQPVQPLTEKARLIYEKLITLQPYEAMTLPKIQDWLYDAHKINLDEGTWKKIRKELKPYGLKNKKRIGYYIEKK